jgi:bloom syndrome protein
LSVQVSDKNRELSAPKTKRSKKTDGKMPPSTNVSSPVRTGNKKRGKRTAVVEKSDDSGGEGPPLHSNGYAKDNFVVSDDDGSDDGFAPLPTHRQRKGPTRKVGPPISHDGRLEDLPEIHQLMVQSFVQEAKQLEEKLRNEKGIHRPLFTETNLREMAIRWTLTLDEMRTLKGIDSSKVDKFGSKFLPLLRQFNNQYKDMMQGVNAESDMDGGLNDHSVVDLISSDLDFDNDYDVNEEDDEDQETSKFFSASAASSSNLPPDVKAFHARLDAVGSTQPSSARAKSVGAGRGRKTAGRGGGRPYARKGKAFGGVTKRKASSTVGRKTSGTTASSSKSTTSTFGSKQGSKSGGKSNSSGGKIGLMPH